MDAAQTLIGLFPITLLIAEGYVLSRILLPKASLLLSLCFALPLSSFVNALITLSLEVTSIALTPLSLGLSHTFILLVSILLGRKKIAPEPQSREKFGRLSPWILWPCALLLSLQFAYSASHALLLPSFQYDSATNWTMRSQISFLDQHLAFDASEERGMAKPQYPILFHALQISANQGQAVWSDALANAIHFLLSLSCLLAVFLLLRSIAGPTIALLSLTAMTSIPLLTIHLAQGYGDITLILFEVLALVATLRWAVAQNTDATRWLLFAGIMIAAGAWTKLEGTSLGLFPWIITTLAVTWRMKKDWKPVTLAIGIALTLTLLWPLFALSHGLSLTPHTSDASFAWHPEAFGEVLYGLFGRGSFGVHWYAAMIASALVFWKYRSSVQATFLLWGWIVCFAVIAIYTLTPNVRFLLNAESFYRQAMLSLALLSIVLPLCFSEEKTNPDLVHSAV